MEHAHLIITKLRQIVDGRVLCIHGGLSPEISTVDQIQTINRCQEIPHQGPLCGKLIILLNIRH